jgi:hypothetical protein
MISPSFSLDERQGVPQIILCLLRPQKCHIQWSAARRIDLSQQNVLVVKKEAKNVVRAHNYDYLCIVFVRMLFSLG